MFIVDENPIGTSYKKKDNDIFKNSWHTFSLSKILTIVLLSKYIDEK